MHKFIVPTKDRIQKWNSLFEEYFREDEHQFVLMQMLITMVMWLHHSQHAKTNQHVELLEATMKMAVELTDTGILDELYTEDAAQMAYEFVTTLFSYMKELDLLNSQVPSILSFQGFVGMDMVIKIFSENEIDEHGEGACLSG